MVAPLVQPVQLAELVELVVILHSERSLQSTVAAAVRVALFQPSQLVAVVAVVLVVSAALVQQLAVREDYQRQPLTEAVHKELREQSPPVQTQMLNSVVRAARV